MPTSAGSDAAFSTRPTKQEPPFQNLPHRPVQPSNGRMIQCSISKHAMHGSLDYYLLNNLPLDLRLQCTVWSGTIEEW